VRWAGRRQRRR